MPNPPSDFVGLLDERSVPDFRTLYGALSARSSAIDVAVGRIRLAGVDLRRSELQGVRAIRVLVSEISTPDFAREAESVLADPDRRANLELLIVLLHRRTIDVRSAPLAGWAPDFSVFHGMSGPRRVVVGTHWFQRPFPYRGPALSSVHGPNEARHAALRFEEIWTAAHDLRPAVQEALDLAHARAGGRTNAPLVGSKILDSPGDIG